MSSTTCVRHPNEQRTCNKIRAEVGPGRPTTSVKSLALFLLAPRSAIPMRVDGEIGYNVEYAGL